MLQKQFEEEPELEQKRVELYTTTLLNVAVANLKFTENAKKSSIFAEKAVSNCTKVCLFFLSSSFLLYSIWQILQQSPNNAKALYTRHKAYVILKDLESAEKDLVAAMKITPDPSISMVSLSIS